MPLGVARIARDRALASLVGLAVGDALGMPTQVLSRARVRSLFGSIETFHAGPSENEVSAGMPAGRITDDTEQALLLARALVAGDGAVDQLRYTAALLAWERSMVERGSLDLLGPSTRRALEAVAAGAPIGESGRWGDTNGSSMRIAPVGICTPTAPLAALVRRVASASVATHATTVANAGAAAVAAAVSRGVDGGTFTDALAIATRAAALGATHGHHVGGADVAARIAWAVDLARTTADPLDAIDRLVGTGVATQETVPAAFAILALHPDDPWRACLVAAGLGGDSDTVAAIVGAIGGACTGIASFPTDAVVQLRVANPELADLEPLVDALLAIRSRGR
jgi:ADP-ribosylglycohydrolase